MIARFLPLLFVVACATPAPATYVVTLTSPHGNVDVVDYNVSREDCDGWARVMRSHAAWKGVIACEVQ